MPANTASPTAPPDPNFPALASVLIASGLPRDPARHPEGLCIKPRVIPATERALEKIRQAFAFTFHGEAAALALTYIALHPEGATFEGLTTVPPHVVAKTARRGYPTNTPLTAFVLDWITTNFREFGDDQNKIAAAILYRNAPALAASLGGTSYAG